MLRILGSLRGLRVQLLLWTVLPLTLILVFVAVTGITTHQQSMREMVEELDARSARLAAAHLNDGLAERVALLQLLASQPWEETEQAYPAFFDGGLARYSANDGLTAAVPFPDVWQKRPVVALYRRVNASPETSSRVRFSSIFVDPQIGRPSLLIGLPTDDGGLIVGAISLKQLGLDEVVGHSPNVVKTGVIEGWLEALFGRSHTLISSNTIAFLVDASGRVIYHPDDALIGQEIPTHEGVQAVIRGETGATYHREPDGQEVVVGYAPIPTANWGLIVQEPWESLIAPVMRISLLAPLAVVAAALVSGLAVTFGLHYVVRPLQALDRQANRVAWGDFSAVNHPVGGVKEIEDLRQTLAGMARQVQRYQTGMRDYIAAVTMAQEEERKRLARELHDETVQSLIALGHRIEMAQKALGRDPEHARQRLSELAQLVAHTQQEVRRFSRALRPLYLEDLGFVPALEMLAQETEREHALSVFVKVEGQIRRLPPDLELTAYRVAQEGLSNVIRHAYARTAWLTVTFEPDQLHLRIQDDGQGFDPPANPADLVHEGHLGLMGIRERALLFGGRLELHSQPGQGTTLEVSLPLPDSQAGNGAL